MKIHLVKPNMFYGRTSDAMQPLFAASLAARTPKGIELSLYDDRIEEIPYHHPVDLAAISIGTFNARRSYEIASEYQKRGVKVIAGGFHPTLVPEEAIQRVDSVFMGDAEDLWPEVIRDFRNDRLKKRYCNPGNNNNAIKFDRSVFDKKPYGPIELVQWGRGCPFNCDFCSIKAFYGSSHPCRPIEDLVKELAGLRNKTVFFVDDNLYHNRSRFKTFLHAITPLNLTWTCQISINIAKDEELLRLMKASGCFLVLIGIESFSKGNLKQMNKSWSHSGLSVEMAIQKIQDHGLLIYGTFIFGYDHDTPVSFKEAVDFAVRNKFFLANFNPLYPMPGTPLYDRLKAQNRLRFDKWWLDPEFYYGKTMYYPKSMTAEELEDYCYQAKMEFNSWQSIIQRSLNFTITTSFKKLMLYLYVNTMNRNEIINKQGKKLGKNQ